MKKRLVVGLCFCLISVPLPLRAAPGASAAGPNDLDRFRLASVNESARPLSGKNISVATKFQTFAMQARSAIPRKQYNVAVSQCTAALQMNPDQNSASVLYDIRADAYDSKNQLGKALDNANASIRLNPQYYSPYFRPGLLFREKGDLEKAISEYNSAIRLNPNFVPAYNNRGVAYSKNNQEESAIRDFNEAIRRDPNYVNAYVNRGASYQEMGRFEEAIANYSEAIRRDPHVDHAHYDRGSLYAFLHNFDRAIADLSEAIRQNSDDAADAYYARATAFKEIDNLPAATADYERAVQFSPKNAHDYADRGRAYFFIGNYHAAASDFTKAEQMAPTNAHVLNQAAWFKATCPADSFRNGTEAVRESTTACELTQSENAHDIDTLAAAYAETGDFGQAVKYETQALDSKSVTAAVRKKMEEHLRLFQNRKPYREESRLRQARTKSAG